MTQQGLVPVPGLAARPARTYETDQSAKISIGDTGTSVTAGQTLSSTEDKWLRKFGAEQKVLDGVTDLRLGQRDAAGRHQQEHQRRLQEKLVNCRLISPVSTAPRRSRLNEPLMPQLGRDEVKIGPPDGPVAIRKFVVRGTLAQREKGKADE